MLFVFAAPLFRALNAVIAGVPLLACSISGGTEPQTVDLRPAPARAGCVQVKVVLETEGKLKLNADGQAVKHLPLRAAADLQYAERILSRPKDWSDVRIVRNYSSASAKMRLSESDLNNELRPDRRIIAVETNAQQAIHFSPLGPLSRDELELISAPASGLALEAILPPRVMTVGSQWTLAESVIARLVGLEAISQQDVACTLDSVKDDLAIVSLAGKVAGAVGGVSSDLELKGKLNFDLRKRAVTWLTIAIKENRAIGHAQPGFEVVTTLRMLCVPCGPIAELTDTALKGLDLNDHGPQTLIELVSEEGGFQLTHDRRWSVMLERNDLTVLRLIDRGDLIAQCNISPRSPLGKNERLTMDGFQEEVKRVLGKNFEQIVEASEEGDEEREVLRVVVAGKAGDLPIQWTYFHVADDQGRRAAFVFTIESSLLERFGHVDRELIGNFRFRAEKEPKKASQEKPARTSARTGSAAVQRGVLR